MLISYLIVIYLYPLHSFFLLYRDLLTSYAQKPAVNLLKLVIL